MSRPGRLVGMLSSVDIDTIPPIKNVDLPVAAREKDDTGRGSSVDVDTTALIAGGLLAFYQGTGRHLFLDRALYVPIGLWWRRISCPILKVQRSRGVQP